MYEYDFLSELKATENGYVFFNENQIEIKEKTDNFDDYYKNLLSALAENNYKILQVSCTHE